jgi:hypothetical protein
VMQAGDDVADQEAVLMSAARCARVCALLHRYHLHLPVRTLRTTAPHHPPCAQPGAIKPSQRGCWLLGHRRGAAEAARATA